MNHHLHTEPHSHIALGHFHICVHRMGSTLYKEGPCRLLGCCEACKVDEVPAANNNITNLNHFLYICRNREDSDIYS